AVGDRLKMRDDREALDLATLVSAQEGLIVAEGDAPVRVAARSEHKGVGKQPRATEDAAADRCQAKRRHAVEERFARRERIERWRRRPAHALMHIGRVIEAV